LMKVCPLLYAMEALFWTTSGNYITIICFKLHKKSQT
jgi:hypothetical protein